MVTITEPVRKSILDVVQHNLHAVKCKTYITRIVYFGRYHGTHEDLQKRMQDIMHGLAADYSDMLITGLFLVYPTFYMHMLEAWEDIIYKHYELMYETVNGECQFGKAIPLPSYHHAYKRFFKEWCNIFLVPPTLLETEEQVLVDVHKEVSDLLMQVYTLCEYISNIVQEKSISVSTALQQLEGPKAIQYLPEIRVVDFILDVQSPVLLTIQEYLLMYSDVSPVEFWDDNNVWPPPCDIMPRDVFDKDGHRKISDNQN